MRRLAALFFPMTLALAPAWAAPIPLQTLDNEGTDFLCAFLPNFTGTTPDIELHLTSKIPTMVTVEYPVGNPFFSTTVAVGPAGITEVVLPPIAGSNWIPGNLGFNLVSAVGTGEFACHLVNRTMFTSDAALALPVDTMNTDYILADWDPTTSSLPSHFVVYARLDDTQVTITPTTDMVGGHVAGSPFTITLDAGEGYYGTSALGGSAGSLSGSTIHADGPIGVSNGVKCVNIPSGVNFCDHIFEVAPAIQTWGDD